MELCLKSNLDETIERDRRKGGYLVIKAKLGHIFRSHQPFVHPALQVAEDTQSLTYTGHRSC
jgi:hypothetical protein